MLDETAFPFDPHEPLGMSIRAIPAPQAYADLRAFHFELTSRGDRVPGRLLLPPRGDGPFPLVLLQHGVGGAKDASYLDATAGPWGRRGAAVASIDFPLHGQRSSSKLSARLLNGLHAGGEPADAVRELVGEFFHQAVVDLRRCLDALEQMPHIDGKRCAYAGFSLGTIVGAAFCGLDPRPRAAVFAIGGSGMGPPELDPARTVGRFAPRPALFLNTTRDETIPREAAEAFFEGAAEPKEMLWFDGTHTELPGEALKAMWLFLKRHLEID